MPIFETDEERTYFLTTILIHPDFLTSSEGRNEVINDGFTDNEKLVLNAMQMDGTITIARMTDMLGLSRSAIERAIKSLKKKDIVQREGSTKKGKWIILK